MAEEKFYLYNVDNYAGVVYIDAEKRTVRFIRENRNWYVDKMIKHLRLEGLNYDPFCSVVEGRTYGRHYKDYKWEIFKKDWGIFCNDTYWISPEKVDGALFWKIHPFADAIHDRYIINREKHLKEYKFELVTKRFLYRILSEYYQSMEFSLHRDFGVVAYDMGCTTVTGAKGVGKTTLLKQLCDSAPDTSYYRDLTGVSIGFDYENFYKDLYNRGIRRIYLDNVCEIPKEDIGEFVSQTKYFSSVILITITGSVKRSVEKISDMIGRGRTVELPPITYAEKLCWQFNYEDNWSFDFRSHTMPERFNEYLSLQNTENILPENALILRAIYLYNSVDKYITSSLYSHDIVALAMKLEYFEREKGFVFDDTTIPLYCTDTIEELIKKHHLI